jgi:hypothetical protein
MRNHVRSLTGALIGFGFAIGLGAVGAAAASDNQLGATAASPRVPGVTPQVAAKGQRNAPAPPATALSPAGAAMRSQITKGQATNMAPVETAASPPGAWLNRPATKPAGWEEGN